MFFGQVISQSTPYTFSPDTVSEEAGEVLSITNIVLAPSSKVYSFFISGIWFSLDQKIKSIILDCIIDQRQTTGYCQSLCLSC
jgi:hypothetical protein